MPNQLAQSLSPYLLQHQDNPVDWVPWSDAAFVTARERDTPVFLSVGYAACHWCHVMAHESFEHEEVGAFLNKHFVCIKVDREERPDIDQIYMNAVQLMTGHGGWPMSAFLDHEARPFYSGTYWPLTPRGGMASFPQVLEAILDAWTNRRKEVEQHAGEMVASLEQLAVGTGDTVEEVAEASRVEVAIEQLLESADTTWGGFGGAPKFPRVTDLLLLWQFADRTGDRRAIEIAELTLDRMAAGGIRDHIGGGFSRYAVDGRWLVPHFEKMLYDNALLMEAYVRGFQVTGNQRHADVAAEIGDYLCRDMIDECGGIHCSEDADSEGVEGKFYVWKPDEVLQTLGESRGPRFCKIYDITTAGNFEGNSIANLPRSITEWAEDLGSDESQLHRELAEDREKLRIARSSRIAPGRDDKIIVAWNALAIRSLVIAGTVLKRSDLVDAAVKAGEFIWDRMRDDQGRLLHTYRLGRADILAMVDDVALLGDAYMRIDAALAGSSSESSAGGASVDAQSAGELSAREQSVWISRAQELAGQLMTHFMDEQDGGFYYTADDAPALITRNKDWHDGALVSGNAAAAGFLLRLGRLIGQASYLSAAEQTLRAGDMVMQKQSRACSALLSVLGEYHHSK